MWRSIVCIPKTKSGTSLLPQTTGLQVLASKVLPETGFYDEKFNTNSVRYKNRGQAIMGDYVGVFAGSKCDGKARIELHNFKRWWKTKHMCDSCMATNPQYKGDHAYKLLTFADFRPEAPWRDTLVSDDQYITETDILSSLAPVPGFKKSLCLRDWAHMDSLGFGRDLGGGLIKSFHKCGELGCGDLDAQLRNLWVDVRHDRKENKKTALAGYFTRANTGMDNLSKYPELGSQFKAKRVDIINKWE